MNICPVLRPLERARRGVIVGSGDEDLELLGAGRFGTVRRRVRLRGASSWSSAARALAMQRRLGRRRHHAPGMPFGFERGPMIPLAFRQGLHGFEDLGNPGKKKKRGGFFRRVGKGLRKVVKSRVFKYAAIGTAAYFTGGAALKFGAPMLKKLAASKLRGRLSRGAGRAGSEAASYLNVPYAGEPTDQAALYPEASAPASYGGGGGGGGGGDYAPDVSEPGDTAPAEASMIGGTGGSGGLLVAGGIVLAAVLASGSKPRRRRRR